ncbi:MAG: OmpA family protein [Alphaproteobacteria bacterium]
MTDKKKSTVLQTFGLYAAAVGVSILYSYCSVDHSDDQQFDPNKYDNDKKPENVMVIPPTQAEENSNNAIKTDENTTNIEQQKSPQIIFPVFFEGQKDTLSEDQKKTLDNMAEYLKTTGDKFEVKGCVTPYEEENSDVALSFRRAHHVANLLKDSGINVIINKTIANWSEAQNNDIYGAYAEECEKYDNKASTQRRVEIITNGISYNND